MTVSPIISADSWKWQGWHQDWMTGWLMRINTNHYLTFKCYITWNSNFSEDKNFIVCKHSSKTFQTAAEETLYNCTIVLNGMGKFMTISFDWVMFTQKKKETILIYQRAKWGIQSRYLSDVEQYFTHLNSYQK